MEYSIYVLSCGEMSENTSEGVSNKTKYCKRRVNHTGRVREKTTNLIPVAIILGNVLWGSDEYDWHAIN